MLLGIPGALVIPHGAAGHPGTGEDFGGFQFEVLDESGGEITGLADATGALIGGGDQDREDHGPLQRRSPRTTRSSSWTSTATRSGAWACR